MALHLITTLQNFHNLFCRQEHNILTLFFNLVVCKNCHKIIHQSILSYNFFKKKICYFIAISLMCNSFKLYFLPQETLSINILMLLEENLQLSYSYYRNIMIFVIPLGNINILLGFVALCWGIFHSVFVKSFLLKGPFCFYLV